MVMIETRVESWNELLEAVYQNTWQPDLRIHRSPFVYRGMGDAAARLETPLMRMGGDYARLEPHLLRNFRKYAHPEAAHSDSDWFWLSLGRHHGLPTRLLDWSLSPLVAMHFATDSTAAYDRDGAIWMVDFDAAHHLLPESLRNALDEEGAQLFTVDMLDQLAPRVEDLAAFKTAGEDVANAGNFLLFFEPPALDDRIVNQYAVFSVLPDAKHAPHDWLLDHPDAVRRLIIPAALKWEVRDKLDQANINERVLFPGLDGLAAWQKRYYTPRNGNPTGDEDGSENPGETGTP